MKTKNIIALVILAIIVVVVVKMFNKNGNGSTAGHQPSDYSMGTLNPVLA